MQLFDTFPWEWGGPQPPERLLEGLVTAGPLPAKAPTGCIYHDDDDDDDDDDGDDDDDDDDDDDARCTCIERPHRSTPATRMTPGLRNDSGSRSPNGPSVVGEPLCAIASTIVVLNIFGA